MTQLLIIYYSRTGGSRQMAHAAVEAARQEADTRLLCAEQAEPGDMIGAAGYIFCGPENLAALAGGMKEFFDLARECQVIPSVRPLAFC